MAVTMMLQDYLGRWLSNPVPGSTDPSTDHLARGVDPGNEDFMGRPLTFPLPDTWQKNWSYRVGDYCSMPHPWDPQITVCRCIVAGKTGASTPQVSALWQVVTDGTVTWVSIH